MKMDWFDHVCMGVAVLNIAFGVFVFNQNHVNQAGFHVLLGAITIAVTIRRMIRG